jgi:hypothetical protein
VFIFGIFFDSVPNLPSTFSIGWILYARLQEPAAHEEGALGLLMRGHIKEVLQATRVISLVCSASTNNVESAKAHSVNNPMQALEHLCLPLPQVRVSESGMHTSIFRQSTSWPTEHDQRQNAGHYM